MSEIKTNPFAMQEELQRRRDEENKLLMENKKLRATLAIYEEALKVYADEHAWGTCGAEAAGNVHEFAYDDEPFSPAKEALDKVNK